MALGFHFFATSHRFYVAQTPWVVYHFKRTYYCTSDDGNSLFLIHSFITYNSSDTKMKTETLKLILGHDVTLEQLISSLEQKFLLLEADNNLFIVNGKVKKISLLKGKENAIMECLAKGYSYKKTADEVKMSVDGVRYYVKRIYKKLDVNNSRQAVNAFFGQVESQE